MANLRPIELKLVDELTGMSNGRVLDFTNRTFAEFFQDEVGVDIYDETYNEDTGSKGKRLRAFLRKAQPRAVARLLTALWEYRENLPHRGRKRRPRPQFPRPPFRDCREARRKRPALSRPTAVGSNGTASAARAPRTLDRRASAASR